MAERGKERPFNVLFFFLFFGWCFEFSFNQKGKNYIKKGMTIHIKIEFDYFFSHSSVGPKKKKKLQIIIN